MVAKIRFSRPCACVVFAKIGHSSHGLSSLSHSAILRMTAAACTASPHSGAEMTSCVPLKSPFFHAITAQLMMSAQLHVSPFRVTV